MDLKQILVLLRPPAILEYIEYYLRNNLMDSVRNPYSIYFRMAVYITAPIYGVSVETKLADSDHGRAYARLG